MRQIVEGGCYYLAANGVSAHGKVTAVSLLALVITIVVLSLLSSVQIFGL
jgi:hypothetical protein